MRTQSDIRYYGGADPLTGAHDEGLPDRFDRTVVSVDCTFKDLSTSDFVAIAVIGVKGRKRFVVNMINAHLDSTGTELEILRQRAMHAPVSAVLVEDKANGSAVIKRLKQSVPGIIAINPEGEKISRVQAMAPEWQAGDWFVSRNAAWTEPFVTQLLMFPSARHDDLVDATSQCAIFLQERTDAFFNWLVKGHEQRVMEEAAQEEVGAGVVPVPSGSAPGSITVNGQRTDHEGNRISAEGSVGRVAIAVPATAPEHKPCFKFEDPYGVLSQPPRPR